MAKSWTAVPYNIHKIHIRSFRLLSAAMAEWNPRDRLAVRAHIRGQMRARNLLQFCDDDPEAVLQAANHPLLSASHLWAQESANSPALIEEGVSATTTDHRMQSIGDLGVENCQCLVPAFLRYDLSKHHPQ